MYVLSSEFSISSVSGSTYRVQRNTGNELIFVRAERYLDSLKHRLLLLICKPIAPAAFAMNDNSWMFQILGEGHKIIEGSAVMLAQVSIFSVSAMLSHI